MVEIQEVYLPCKCCKREIQERQEFFTVMSNTMKKSVDEKVKVFVFGICNECGEKEFDKIFLD